VRAVVEREGGSLGRDVAEWLAPIVLLAVVFWTAIGPLQRDEVWRHLRVGESTLSEGAVASVDRCSHTVAGASDPNGQWLSQIALASAHRIAGGSSLITLRGVLLTVCVLLLFLTIRWRGFTIASALPAVTLAWLGILRQVEIGPQIFSWLLLTLSLLISAAWLQRYRWARWSLPVLALLWANLHAAQAPALLIIVIACALQDTLDAHPFMRRQRLRDGAIQFALVVAALLVTPSGPGALGASLQRLVEGGGVLSDWTRRPFELALLSAREPVSSIVFSLTALAALGFGLVRWRRGRLGAQDLVLCLALGLLALGQPRWIPGFMLATAPGVAAGLDRLTRRRAAAWRGGRAALIAIGACGGALLLLGPFARDLAPRGRVAWERFPDDAVLWLKREAPPGRVFNRVEFGDFLTWALPGRPVFIDGREELYRAAGLDRIYLEAWSDPLSLEWTALTYGVSLVIDRNDGPVTPPQEKTRRARLLPQRRWALVFHGPVASIYLRRSPEAEAFIEAHEYRLISPGHAASYVDPLASAGEEVEALGEEIERLLAQAPRFAEAWVLLGRYRQVALDAPEGAREAYREARAIDPLVPLP
jgi:hypothetical protein